jgi:hypothetical protein
LPQDAFNPGIVNRPVDENKILKIAAMPAEIMTILKAVEVVIIITSYPII